LVTNARFQPRGYWTLSKDTIAIIQRLSVLVAFFAVFYHIFGGTMSPNTLLVIDVVTMFVGSVIALTRTRELSSYSNVLLSVRASVKRMLLLTGTLFAFSPVLQTLTKTYSHDTIWALTFLFSAIHLALHDYKYVTNADANPAPAFEGTISLNAGIFSSVLLASRLDSHLSVFAFVLFAFEVHGGFPVVAHHIRRYSEKVHWLFSAILSIICGVALSGINGLLAIIYIFGVLFILLVCPFWLKRIQRYKNEMQGPWDYDDEKEIQAEIE